jgi:HAD superfamily hydrolase (TIGR01484 family)
MKSIKELDAESAAKIKYVLFDIDDTITNNGKLIPEAYNAMWKLHNAGYNLIPVTGRPAGWCDLIIREWPVDAVVGENGAFVYYFQDSQFKTFIHPDVANSEIHKKLGAIEAACIEQVPGCRVTKDQPFRRYDLALDFNEDFPHLGLEAAQKIKDICISMGAEAKISSIHVNVWYGNYDKVRMTQLFLQKIMGVSDIKSSVIFFGDSPNDEPMFTYFPNSCGVANIMPFISKMACLPKYVTVKEGGFGFSEGVSQILMESLPDPCPYNQ